MMSHASPDFEQSIPGTGMTESVAMPDSLEAQLRGLARQALDGFFARDPLPQTIGVGRLLRSVIPAEDLPLDKTQFGYFISEVEEEERLSFGEGKRYLIVQEGVEPTPLAGSSATTRPYKTSPNSAGRSLSERELEIALTRIRKDPDVRRAIRLQSRGRRHTPRAPSKEQ